MFRFDAFLEHLAERQRAPATIHEYRYELGRLAAFLARRGVLDDREVTRALFVEFLDRPGKNRPSADYMAKVAGMIRGYFTFLVAAGHLFGSPVPDRLPRRETIRHYPVVRHEEVARLLDAIAADDPISVRGRAMLELAYSAALRPREIYSLKLRDIDYERGLLFIQQSKGHKDRLVPAGRRALGWVSRYVTDIRPWFAAKDSEYVFVSHKNGGKLTAKGVWWAVGEALRRAGVARITPYSLRGSAATALLAQGMGVGYIQRLLGHANITTTVTYLQIEEKELSAKVGRAHPRTKWRVDRASTRRHV